MTHIDLNADLGEGYGPWRMGDDAALLDIVTSANVACGAHAGDPNVMAETFRRAAARGVAIGAHPGYDDKPGFGRRVLPMSADEIRQMVAYQIGAAKGVAALVGARVAYVKAHGALSNVAQTDMAVAEAIAAATKAVDPGLTLLVMPETAAERAGEASGLRLAREIFADRAYNPDLTLVSRAKPGAVLHDAAEIAARMVEMVRRGAVPAGDAWRPVRMDSICVHGDEPTAVAAARAVRAALEAAGVRLAPFVGAGA